MTEIPLPSALVRAPVTWTLGHADTTGPLKAARGFVRFEASAIAVAYSDRTVLPSPVETPFVAGVMTPVDLIVNDPDVWNWKVTVKAGGVTWDPFHINVPAEGTNLASASITPGKGPVKVLKGDRGAQGASLDSLEQIADDTLRAVIHDPLTGVDDVKTFDLPRGPEGPYGGTEVTDPQVASYITDQTETRAALDTAMVDRFGPSISPYSFGAVGDGVTDDSDAWQAFLDHCAATDVGTAQVAGTFALSKGLLYQPIGAAAEVKTLLFSGKTTFVGTSGSGGEYMMKVVNAPQLKWEHLKMRGTGVATSWASRGWRVGLWLDRVARASFGALVADYFAFAGVWAGHNNNSLNDYGASRFSFCGSGQRTWTDGRATTTWSSEVQSGSATSASQKSEITVDTLPPAYVMDNTFEQSALMLRITLTTGETRLFHVESIDQPSKTVSVTPWIGNGDTALVADWVFGGGIVLNGADSNVVTFTGLDARYCGIGLNCGSLYVPVASRVVAQFCGTAITLGRTPTGSILGGELTGIYVEGNTEDIVWVSRPGTASVYTVLDSEYALNLKKCYVVGALRDADGTENGRYSDFGGRFTYKGRSYEPLKGARNRTYRVSTRLIDINRPEQYDIQFSNGRTIRYSLDVDVHRLTGYDTARLLVVGTGANGAPSGTVTFDIPDGVTPTGAPWTLNGGTTSVAFTGFDAATEFLVRFDFESGDCTVARLTPRMSATTAELESASNQINTTNKTPGRTVYNSNTRKSVTAGGAAASSAWYDSAGDVAHTPA